MKYEYLIITTAPSGEGHSKTLAEAALNDKGKQGWRVVNTIPFDNGTWILMEKELGE